MGRRKSTAPAANSAQRISGWQAAGFAAEDEEHRFPAASFRTDWLDAPLVVIANRRRPASAALQAAQSA
jgi:hypothetical protein